MDQTENEVKSKEKNPEQNMNLKKRMEDRPITKFSYRHAVKCYQKAMKLKYLKRLNSGEKDENIDS